MSISMRSDYVPMRASQSISELGRVLQTETHLIVQTQRHLYVACVAPAYSKAAEDVRVRACVCESARARAYVSKQAAGTAFPPP